VKKKLTICAAVLCVTVLSIVSVYANVTRANYTIPVATASGISVHRNSKAEIDFSNASDGYIMVRFLAQINTSVRVLITGPDGIQYQYHITTPNRWEVFTLTGGNGQYIIGVFEQVEGNRFANVISTNINVTITDEFAPFLRPNQFVNFNRSSAAVTEAARLVRGSTSVIESVSRVYNFVIENIEYDTVLAQNIRSGYIPDIDAVLESGRGICFDYAALMTAMLRSQGIPTKLVIGNVGDLRHAWISVHSEETGWINNIIFFDGIEWRIMDPTFAANSNQSGNVMRFIGDGTNHRSTHYH
jgi:hypothetical protein